MHDQSRHVALPPSLRRTGRLDRRTLLRIAGAAGVARPFAAALHRPAFAAQDADSAIIRSQPRAEVMQEILEHHPLRREGAPAGGSVIFGNLGDLESVNPLLAGSIGNADFLSLVYESLVGIHPIDGSIIPGLADYELAADGVTYTFHIHPDARFHDGAPVTAADAEFSLSTIFDPDGLSLAAIFQAVLKEFRAVDDRTFVMVSNDRIASFLYDAALFPVLPQQIWADVAAADLPFDPGSTGQDPARVVGSGPFTFKEWDQGSHATLERNPNYWNRELSRVPYLDNLVFQVMSNSDARLVAMEAGDIDLGRLSPSDAERIANADGFAVVSSETLAFTYYAYQLKREETPLFQDKAVRQALFIALDRQAIVDSILLGQATVARGPQPPLSPAYRPNEFDEYAYDPHRARELLAQAGWTDADGDGFVEKEGRRFSFSMLVRGDSTLRLNIATYMQDAWKDIGVDMAVEPLDFGTFLDRTDVGDFEMALLGQGLSIDPGQGWMFETGANFFGYSNPEHDRLEAEQRTTLDPAQRVDLIIAQAKIVWDELPIGILYFDRQVVGHNQRLRNFFPNAYGGVFWSAPFWYLEP